LVKLTKRNLIDGAGIAGTLLISAGFWLYHPGLGLIAGGIILLGLSLGGVLRS